MKFQNWKETAELVGIAAIVASLLFVGLQMRQTGEIARGQMYSNQLANALTAYSAISGHPDIWVRGKHGDELDPADAEVFLTQVLALADQAYYDYIADFAGFLYENPGVRRVWQAEEQRLREIRRVVMPGEHRSTWSDQVNEILMRIEQAHASARAVQ